VKAVSTALNNIDPETLNELKSSIEGVLEKLEIGGFSVSDSILSSLKTRIEEYFKKNHPILYIGYTLLKTKQEIDKAKEKPIEGEASGTGPKGAPYTGTYLTGEEGPELVQTTDGHAYLVGTKGPQMAQLNKGDVVYSNPETKKIFQRRNLNLPTDKQLLRYAEGTPGSSIKQKIGGAIDLLVNLAVEIVNPASEESEEDERKDTSTNINIDGDNNQVVNQIANTETNANTDPATNTFIP
jgi:hypothetical protein